MNQSELQDLLAQAHALRIKRNAFVSSVSKVVKEKHAAYLKVEGGDEAGLSLEFLGNNILVFASVLFGYPNIAIRVKFEDKVLAQATMDANGLVTFASNDIRSMDQAADDILFQMFASMKQIGLSVFR